LRRRIHGVESAQALAFVRACGKSGRLLITQSSERRFRKRGLTLRDVRQVLTRADECKKHKNGNWKVKGLDLDGVELSLIVTIAGRAVVVL